jgi:pimeloyl-ACP methyl ester carboxylesterase
MDRSVRKAIMDDTVNKGTYRKAFGITTEAMTAAIPLRRTGISAGYRRDCRVPRCFSAMPKRHGQLKKHSIGRPKGAPQTVHHETPTMTERQLKPLPFIQTGSGARALVFIHGLFDDGGFWRRTIQALETRYLALVTLDLPGMGKAADDPGPFSLDRLARAVTSVVDPVNRPTILVGHSMGAQIAELVAAMRPRQITGLVLLSPVPLGGMALPELRATAFRSFGGNLKGERERLQSTSYLQAADLANVAATRATLHPTTVAALFDAWSDGHESGMEPSVVKAPVLIIHGVDDRFVTRDLLTNAILPRFGRARITSISNASHWPHLEQPAATAKAIDGFLAEIGGSHVR